MPSLQIQRKAENMIRFKEGKCSKKEKENINSILQELTDTYSDFYITRNRLRLFIKENKDLLFDSLAKGDKIAYAEDEGIAFITGWSDKSPRKYLKIIGFDLEKTDHLIKVINWHCEDQLFAKIKKNNPIRRILQKNGFIFYGDRGREILLVRDNIYSNNKGGE